MLPPGVRRVVRKRPEGGEDVYLYAWRGKGAPRLYEAPGSEALWKEYREALKSWGRTQAPAHSVSGWLERWAEHLDARRRDGTLAKSTRNAYERHIGRIRARFGRADPRAFCEPAMRREVKAWHADRELAPAAADKALDCLLAFLSWLLDDGVIGAHVCGDIPRRWESDRSDLIWTPEHVETFRAGAPLPLVWAMDIARLTALAPCELVRLEWTHFDVDEIEIRRQKTGELALVPILPELRDVVAKIPRRHARVLTSSRGTPYTAGALSARFSETLAKLNIDRHLYDLRGTACTELCAAGLDDREVAEIMGWGTDDVAAIRRRYVGRRAIINRAVEKIADLQRAKAGKSAKAAA